MLYVYAMLILFSPYRRVKTELMVQMDGVSDSVGGSNANSAASDANSAPTDTEVR